PGIVAEQPLPAAARLQSSNVRLWRDGRFQQRGYRDPARVLAQLLREHVACRPARQRLAHGGVVARMLPWRDIDEHTTRQCGRRTRQTEDKPVLSRGRDRPLEVELDPTLGTGRDLVAFEHD